jgi:hypothetical protein
MRPTGYPEWCSSGGASSIVEPTSTKKGVGWTIAEKPPAGYLNWLDNLQSQWIKYLGYDWIVDEDWNCSPFLLNSGVTLYPKWHYEVPTGAVNFGFPAAANNPANPHQDANGVFKVGAHALGGGSGYERLLSFVGYPRSRDFIYETRMKLAALPTGLGSNTGMFWWGLFSRPSGPTMLAGFVTTGPSYQVAFAWQPSGGAPTCVPAWTPTTTMDTSSTGYNWYYIEQSNNALTARYNSTLVASLASSQLLELNSSNSQLGVVGAWTYTDSSGLAYQYIDKIRLGIKR